MVIDHHNTFQIIVSSFPPNETHLTDGSEFLTTNTDSHAILGGHSSKTVRQGKETIQNVTQKGESFLRGKWVTVAAVDWGVPPLELAEIRVYGSESFLLLIRNVGRAKEKK